MGRFINGKSVKVLSGKRVKLKNKRVYIEKYTRDFYGLRWVVLQDRKKRLIKVTDVFLTQETLEATTSLMFDMLGMFEEEENAND